MNFRATETTRRLLVLLAATLTIKGEKWYTMTDVIERAIRELAERMKVKA